MLFIAIFLTLVVVITSVAVFCLKRCKLSEKGKERVKSLKQKIFWNPLIRYTMLSAIKLNISAMIIFRLGWPKDSIQGILALV